MTDAANRARASHRSSASRGAKAPGPAASAASARTREASAAGASALSDACRTRPSQIIDSRACDALGAGVPRDDSLLDDVVREQIEEPLGLDRAGEAHDDPTTRRGMARARGPGGGLASPRRRAPRSTRRRARRSSPRAPRSRLPRAREPAIPARTRRATRSGYPASRAIRKRRFGRGGRAFESLTASALAGARELRRRARDRVRGARVQPRGAQRARREPRVLRLAEEIEERDEVRSPPSARSSVRPSPNCARLDARMSPSARIAAATHASSATPRRSPSTTTRAARGCTAKRSIARPVAVTRRRRRARRDVAGARAPRARAPPGGASSQGTSAVPSAASSSHVCARSRRRISGVSCSGRDSKSARV